MQTYTLEDLKADLQYFRLFVKVVERDEFGVNTSYAIEQLPKQYDKIVSRVERILIEKSELISRLDEIRAYHHREGYDTCPFCQPLSETPDEHCPLRPLSWE